MDTAGRPHIGFKILSLVSGDTSINLSFVYTYRTVTEYEITSKSDNIYDGDNDYEDGGSSLFSKVEICGITLFCLSDCEVKMVIVRHLEFSKCKYFQILSRISRLQYKSSQKSRI